MVLFGLVLKLFFGSCSVVETLPYCGNWGLIFSWHSQASWTWTSTRPTWSCTCLVLGRSTGSEAMAIAHCYILQTSHWIWTCWLLEKMWYSMHRMPLYLIHSCFVWHVCLQNQNASLWKLKQSTWCLLTWGFMGMHVWQQFAQHDALHNNDFALGLAICKCCGAMLMVYHVHGFYIEKCRHANTMHASRCCSFTSHCITCLWLNLAFCFVFLGMKPSG